MGRTTLGFRRHRRGPGQVRLGTPMAMAAGEGGGEDCHGHLRAMAGARTTKWARVGDGRRD